MGKNGFHYEEKESPDRLSLQSYANFPPNNKLFHSSRANVLKRKQPKHPIVLFFF